MSQNLSEENLEQYVTRWEAIAEEIKGLRADLTELKKNMKGEGFDTKVVGKLIRERARSKADRDMEDQLLQVYADAIGIQL